MAFPAVRSGVCPTTPIAQYRFTKITDREVEFLTKDLKKKRVVTTDYLIEEFVEALAARTGPTSKPRSRPACGLCEAHHGVQLWPGIFGAGNANVHKLASHLSRVEILPYSPAFIIASDERLWEYRNARHRMDFHPLCMVSVTHVSSNYFDVRSNRWNLHRAGVSHTSRLSVCLCRRHELADNFKNEIASLIRHIAWI
jgi:hypothetical protein